MAGWLERRGGIWYFCISINGRTWKRSLRTRNEREARRLRKVALEAILARAAGRRPATSKETRFSAVVDLELQADELARVWRSKERRDREAMFAHHILPVIGHLDLEVITMADLEELREALTEKGLSVNSQRLALAYTRRVFRWSARRLGTRNNPFSAGEILPAPPEGDPRHLSDNELAEIWRLAPVSCHLAMALSLYAGLRWLETQRLTRHAVDLSGGMIALRGPDIKKRTTRNVPIIPVLFSFLEKSLRDSQAIQVVSWRPAFPASLSRAIAKGGGPRFSFRDFRSTFACRLLNDGVPLDIVSELLGHRSVETTRNHYARYLSETKRARFLDVAGKWTCPGS